MFGFVQHFMGCFWWAIKIVSKSSAIFFAFDGPCACGHYFVLGGNGKNKCVLQQKPKKNLVFYLLNIVDISMENNNNNIMKVNAKFLEICWMTQFRFAGGVSRLSICVVLCMFPLTFVPINVCDIWTAKSQMEAFAFILI